MVNSIGEKSAPNVQLRKRFRVYLSRDFTGRDRRPVPSRRILLLEESDRILRVRARDPLWFRENLPDLYINQV